MSDGVNTMVKKFKKSLPGNQTAGTGVIGLIGFVFLFFIAAIFFITENYFVAMTVISLALLVYLTGTGIARVMVSSFTIFFSSRHLLNKAVCIQETLKAFEDKLGVVRDGVGAFESDDPEENAVILLPDNDLVRDLKQLLEEGKDYESARYLAHNYYSECLELYDNTNGHLEFVADAMPLFGLIGTILGLIAMFDGLGANVTVESLAPQLAMALKTTLYGAVFSSIYKVVGSRFDQRLKSLEFDFEAFCYGLQVLMNHKSKIELEV